MRYFILAILSSTLICVVGCTEENQDQSGWDVGQNDGGQSDVYQSDGGHDSSQDSGGSDASDDADDATEPNADGGTEPDADGGTEPDTGECGAQDQMCDWDCPQQDPDCDRCPDTSDFTEGPWDTQECALIDFGCREGSSHYFDDVCGCGCLPDNSDPCAAQDARGQGACAAVIGVVWDGDSCTTISGCSCEGTDCDDLYDSQSECQRDNIECGATARCGGFGGIQCPDDMYCDYDTDICGATDGQGDCKERPEACNFNMDRVCGCDGQFYTNECFANAAGVDIREDLDSCQR